MCICLCVCVCVFPLVTCLLDNYVDKHRFTDQQRLRKENIVKRGSVLTVVEKIMQGTPLAPLSCHTYTVIVLSARGGNGSGIFHRTAEVLNIFVTLL